MVASLFEFCCQYELQTNKFDNEKFSKKISDFQNSQQLRSSRQDLFDLFDKPDFYSDDNQADIEIASKKYVLDLTKCFWWVSDEGNRAE